MQSYLQLARVYMVTGNPDQAIAIYQKAPRFSPTLPTSVSPWVKFISGRTT